MDSLVRLAPTRVAWHVPLPKELDDVSEASKHATEHEVRIQFPERARVDRTNSFWIHLRPWFPVQKWLSQYTMDNFAADITAGLTVGAVIVPQAMAYAELAELPAIYGLYSALIPLPMYAMMGTSPHLAIGPFALVSLLIPESLEAAGFSSDDPEYISLVLTLTFLVGLVHLAMGVLRMGALIVRLISDTVLTGFTCAAAFLISASQLRHLLAIHVPRERFFKTLLHVAQNARQVNYLAVGVGLGSLVALAGLQRLKQRCCARICFPEQLLLLVAATSLSWLLGLEPREDDSEQWLALPVVGKVPSGLPKPAIPIFEARTLVALIQPALIVGFFSFILTIAMVRVYALQFGYATDANQELFALGFANLTGAFFSAYPTSGSLSRTALVAAAGGARVTPCHGVTTSLLVLLILFVFTPAFQPMPNAVLAAIVLSAVRPLVDFHKALDLYRVSGLEAAVWACSFSGCLIFGAPIGICLGVLASMLLIILRSAMPNYAVLGQLPRTTLFRDVLRYPQVNQLTPTERPHKCHDLF